MWRSFGRFLGRGERECVCVCPSLFPPPSLSSSSSSSSSSPSSLRNLSSLSFSPFSSRQVHVSSFNVPLSQSLSFSSTMTSSSFSSFHSKSSSLFSPPSSHSSRSSSWMMTSSSKSSLSNNFSHQNDSEKESNERFSSSSKLLTTIPLMFLLSQSLSDDEKEFSLNAFMTDLTEKNLILTEEGPLSPFSAFFRPFWQSSESTEEGESKGQKVASQQEEEEEGGKENTKKETSRVKKVKLGEREVMPLGVGTMYWGFSYLDSLVGTLPTHEALREVVRVADEAGVSVYDTAEGYGGGTSEERLGQILMRTFENGRRRGEGERGEKREETVVMTKFLPAFWRWSRQQFFHSLEESRHRLGRPIQIYYIHSPMHPLFTTWIRCACEARQKGLIEEIGLSNCDAAQVKMAVEISKEYGQRIAANQVLYSLLSYKSPQIREVERVCRENDITIVAYGVLGQGLLTDNLTPEKFKVNRGAKVTGLTLEELSPLRACIKEISETHKVTMAQVCLNWAMQKGAISLVGAKDSSHLTDAIGALNFSLTPSEMERLDDASLDKSTLDKSSFRRSLFLFFISVAIFFYYVARWLRIPSPLPPLSSLENEDSQKPE